MLKFELFTLTELWVIIDTNYNAGVPDLRKSNKPFHHVRNRFICVCVVTYIFVANTHKNDFKNLNIQKDKPWKLK